MRYPRSFTEQETEREVVNNDEPESRHVVEVETESKQFVYFTDKNAGLNC